MSLTPAERQTLARIEDSLRSSDPRLPDGSAAIRRTVDTRSVLPLRIARARPGIRRLAAPRPKIPRAG
jgi:hypothetical protein